MIDITKSKIEGIRSLRRFCKVEFGRQCGLMVAKHLIDNLSAEITKEEETRRAVANSLLAAEGLFQDEDTRRAYMSALVQE